MGMGQALSSDLSSSLACLQVLATDMSKHMNLLADLKTMVETKKVSRNVNYEAMRSLFS